VRSIKFPSVGCAVTKHTTDQISLSVRQFTEAWRVFCTAPPVHVATQQKGVEYIFSGLPVAFFNVVAITERIVSPEALRGHARAACEWAGAKGVPWFFVVTHDALTDDSVTAEVLGECDLAPMVPLTGMRAGRVAPLGSLPDGLQLAQPDDDAGCAALVTVNGAAYGVPLDTCIEAIGSHRLWRDHVAVVGRVDGKPVTCSAVVQVDGYRYVAFVATDPGA
jgi:hypothetical protein